ncbi:MAG: phosphoribosylglycinamide formyltransferase [Alphaproteobacteria bacterium]|nr:phosphoribosylglycinamide formyltransferase [Alphaproteobacteria bacterium]
MGRLNLAVLISGRGSNLQALIDACAAAAYPAQIKVVISNRPDAYGLIRAQAAGIATAVVDHTAFDGKPAFEAALQAELSRHSVDFICLAGFMRVLGADFVNQWPSAIINIHPSLLPDYKGLDTHARALADGRTEGGCSVHYVTPALDDGPVILQKRVPIKAGDTADSLAARVLVAEHEAYPEAVALIARQRIKIIEETAGIGE